MNRYAAMGLVAVGLLASSVAAAADSCGLQLYGELPVTMRYGRPIVKGTINGQPAWFMVASGAYYSSLSSESAEKLGLTTSPMPAGSDPVGFFGKQNDRKATVRKLTIDGFMNGMEIDNIEFLVEPGPARAGIDGLVGQNLIGRGSAEYDLANGIIRLFREENCKGTMLAYWHGASSVAEMSIDRVTPAAPHIVGDAKLNGTKVRVLLSTGSASSLVSLKMAERLGVRPEDEGIDRGGVITDGRRAADTWIGRFEVLDLGGEQIRNSRLYIADTSYIRNADLFLGSDFFLSHRIFVSAAQRKMWFTYNGGAVFDLSANRKQDQSEAEQEAGVAAVAGDKPAGGERAAELKRRGMASASRQQFASAIADYDEVLRIDPSDADTLLQRAMAYQCLGQVEEASADLDRSLEIRPGHIQTLLARSGLRKARKDMVGAREDLALPIEQAVDDFDLTKSAAVLLRSMELYDDAVAVVDAWLARHPDDTRTALALSDRCWTRAMDGKDLDLALADCDAAIRKSSRNSEILDTRGFVHLRMGNWDKSIADYQRAIKLQPRMATSLYGLGLAEFRKGMQEQGERDVKAAIAIDAGVAECFDTYGLRPPEK